MTPDVRKLLISLLQDEQKAQGLSNRAFAKKLDVTAPWLNRFYEDTTRVREGSIDPVIQYFKQKTVDDLVNLAQERQLSDESNELNVGGGFTVWGLPLFLLFAEKRLPKSLKVSFTKNEDGDPSPINTWSELETKLLEGDIPLNAADLITYSNQDAEIFDVVLIPEDLRDDLTDSGIFKIAELSTGFAVELYIIGTGKIMEAFQAMALDENIDNQKFCCISHLKSIRENIKKVYHLPGTAALNQWETFLQSKVVDPKYTETVLKLIPELSKQRQSIETEVIENYLKKPSFNADDLYLLIAYEPFANNFYHRNFDPTIYKYSRFNISRWIDTKVCMVLLANKTSLLSKHKSTKIQELLKALQTVVVKEKYESAQASIAEIFFKGKNHDEDEWDRLQTSIKHVTYHLKKSELATFLFDSK